MTLASALRFNPKFTFIWFGQGLIQGERERVNESIHSLTRAIELAPEDPTGLHNRAILLLDRKEPEKAVADLNQVIRLDKSNAKAYLNRGRAWIQLRKPDKASADFEAALRIQPDLVEAKEALRTLKK